MKLLFALVLITRVSFLVSAQNEYTLLDVSLNNIANGTFNDENKKTIHHASTTTNTIDLSLNYGHQLNKKNLLFYSVFYRNTHIKTHSFGDTSNGDYKHPSHANLSLNIGHELTLSNNWSLISLLDINLTDDFFKPVFQTSTQHGAMVYSEKKTH